jgi:hypothetical protein
MTVNIGSFDRIIRLVIGVALLYFALFAQPNGYNWIGWVGIIPILTALIGNCPLYSILGLNTCRAK